MSNELARGWTGWIMDRVLGAQRLAVLCGCSFWLLQMLMREQHCAVSFVQAVKNEHADVLCQHPAIDLNAVSATRTMAAFDGAAIAPMMGEPSASQYYRTASGARLLHCVTAPTLLVRR
eukprot:SAG31_NODE_16648_length_701_cov_1.367110_2_plen_118_part_01